MSELFPHPPTPELARYVQGALDAACAARVEAHVGGCAACAAALASEARFEVMLGELAAAVPARSELAVAAGAGAARGTARRALVRRVAGVGLASLAAAAAAVVALGFASPAVHRAANAESDGAASGPSRDERGGARRACGAYGADGAAPCYASTQPAQRYADASVMQ